MNADAGQVGNLPHAERIGICATIKFEGVQAVQKTEWRFLIWLALRPGRLCPWLGCHLRRQ
jgi:hypothetical protein